MRFKLEQINCLTPTFFFGLDLLDFVSKEVGNDSKDIFLMQLSLLTILKEIKNNI